LNITFLLGAGASKPLGIPTTEDLAKEFLGLKNDPELEYILDKKQTEDIEELIRVVQRVKELQFNEGLTLCDVNEQDFDSIRFYSHKFEEIEQEIFEFIRKKCRNPDVQKATQLYKPLLDLRDKANIDIFTTNYDIALEEVCRTLKISYIDGFSQEEHGYNKIFSPENFTEGAVRLFKLHGSINWWSDYLKQKIFCLDPQIPGIEGFKNLMIYPAEKDDLFNYPFNIIQVLFNIVLNKTNELIAIGHKFGDKNITAIVTAMLERTNFKLTIVDPSAKSIKERVFKNHPNVVAFEKRFEEWVDEGEVVQLVMKIDLENEKKMKKWELDNQRLQAIKDLETTKIGSIPYVPVAKFSPDQKGVLIDVFSFKDRFACPKCASIFSVHKLLLSFDCPNCNAKLTR
jgi:hypothetical protein